MYPIEKGIPIPEGSHRYFPLQLVLNQTECVPTVTEQSTLMNEKKPIR